MDLTAVRDGFVAAGIPARLAEELLDGYAEAKRRYHLRDLRPQQIEGGRFAEAAFRILQHACGKDVTPLGRTLPSVDKLLKLFENETGQPDAVRFHIPQTLKVVYGIRNKRDIAHLGDEIDPNLQDATLVIGNMDWVVAELVRLYHNVTPDDAQRIIEELVTKEVPAVELIEGQPVINADLQPRDRALLLLYRAGTAGASFDEMAAWLRVPPNQRGNLRKRLAALDKDGRVLQHPENGRYYLTGKGRQDVETRGLARPA
jgi:hypothetical protein